MDHPPEGPLRDRLPFSLVLIACVFLLAVTAPVDYGDTPVYVSDILAHHSGELRRGIDPLWEFGHVLWRPLGYMVWRIARPVLELPGEPPTLPVFRAVALLSAAFSVLLAWPLYAVARIYAGSRVDAGLIAVGFFSTNAVLNFAKSGSAYVPGLALAMLALWLARGGCSARNWKAARFAGAGATLAGAISLWFPFVLSIPGVILAILLWNGSLRGRLRAVAVFCLVLGAMLLAVYGLAAWQAGIATPADALDWYRNASHGMRPYHGVARLATGLPRGFYDLGQDGLILKRFYLRDVYAPVGVADLVSLGWWKPLVFYLWLGFLAWSLWRAAEGRRLLLLQAVTWGPALVFAALVFEPSSRERFLPVFPFLLLAATSAASRYSGNRLKRLAVVGPLLLSIAINAPALMMFRNQRAFAHDVARIAALRTNLPPASLVIVASLRDGISRFQSQNPFHPLVRDGRLRLYYAVWIGSEQAAHWRARFARSALRTWNGSGDVWVSNRLLAARPKPEWLWAEGEDPYARWADLPALFLRFDYDLSAGDQDGFRRLKRSPDNRTVLETLSAEGPQPVSRFSPGRFNELAHHREGTIPGEFIQSTRTGKH